MSSGPDFQKFFFQLIFREIWNRSSLSPNLVKKYFKFPVLGSFLLRHTNFAHICIVLNVNVSISFG